MSWPILVKVNVYAKSANGVITNEILKKKGLLSLADHYNLLNFELSFSKRHIVVT